MLLKSYSKEIFRPKCNPGFESLHCIAHLDQDISEVLPYLKNTVLGGFEYLKDPPAVIFRSQGKFAAVHGCKIAINALRDPYNIRETGIDTAQAMGVSRATLWPMIKKYELVQ